MNLEYQKVHSFDGLQLHTFSSVVQDERAKLLLIHGYAEYAARYHHFVEILNEQGISVYTFDLRGHG